jgi:hypothetical protein
MTQTTKQFALSACAGFVLLACIAGIACIPHAGPAGVLLLPGALLAALVFPQGIESGYGITYMILAGFLDGLLYSLVALPFIRRNFSKKLPQPDSNN